MNVVKVKRDKFQYRKKSRPASRVAKCVHLRGPQMNPPQGPGLAKAHFQGSYLLCEFFCYEVVTYHFRNFSASPKII